MATIRTLNVLLGIDTKKFKKGMRGAKGDIRGFVRVVRGASKSLVAFGAVLTGAAVGGGIAVMVKRSVDLADQLAKTSQKLGIASEDLAGLRFAAEQTGVGANTLDMALQRMTRRISEAADGTGEAKQAIMDLGLSAKELERLGPGEAFRQLSDALLTVENQSDRVRLAFKLFDSEGVALVNTAALGSEGLQKMSDEAERLGVALSAADLAQFESVANSMGRLRTQATGFQFQLARELLPLIDTMAARLGQINITKLDLSGFVPALREFALFSGLVLDIWSAVARLFQEAQLAATQLSLLTAKASTGLDRLAEKLIDPTNFAQNESIRKTLIANLTEEIQTLKKELEEPPNTKSFFDRATDFFDEVERRRAESAADAAANVLEPLNFSANLQPVIEDVGILGIEIQKLENIAQGMGNAFADALTDAVIGAESATEAIKRLGEAILRLVFQELVAAPIAGAITTGLREVFRIPQPAVSAKGNFFTSPDITTIAERGQPEAVLPLTRLPGGDLGVRAAGAGGGAGVRVIINNQSGGEVTTETRDRPGGGQDIIVQISKAMAQDVREGGPLGRELRRVHGLNRTGVPR